MALIAACALLGALDRLLGNRFGLGKAFEEGFRMLGPIALSMAGITCFAPLLSAWLAPAIHGLCTALHLEPAMCGAVLAIDMGGWDMATGLAVNEVYGRFAGTVAAATLGCTLSFTVPVSMGMLAEDGRRAFAHGVLWGLVTLPLALLLGALLGGIGLGGALWLCAPSAVLALLVALALARFQRQTLRLFAGFAWLLRALGTAGLALGAVEQLTGWTILPGLKPLPEAMATVSAIGVVLLGSLPLAELMQRALKRPLSWIGRHLGLSSDSLTCMLLLYINVTPGLIALSRLRFGEQRVCAAFAVCAASALTAHFAFTVQAAQEWALPLLAAKAFGAVTAAALALAAQRRSKTGSMR